MELKLEGSKYRFDFCIINVLLRLPMQCPSVSHARTSWEFQCRQAKKNPKQ